MKLHGIAATIAAVLISTTASAQSANNAVWGVNVQNEVFRWNSSQSKFELIPGRLKQISVGADGAVCGIDLDDNVACRAGPAWQQISGEKLKQLSVINAQEIWGVNAGGELFRWNRVAWQKINTPSSIPFVSAGADGSVWTIGNPGAGSFLELDRDTLELSLLPATLALPKVSRLSVTDTNRAWAIDENADLFRYTRMSDQWQPFENNRKYIDVAEAANGELWRLADDGTILFNRNPSALTLQMQKGPLLTQIAVGSAGEGEIAQELTADQQLTLDAHNIERRNYPGVGALQWSTELARFAEEWAQEVARNDAMTHRQGQLLVLANPIGPNEAIGENIFGWGSSVTGADAVHSWTAEKQWYHYDQDDGGGARGLPPGCTAGKKCGHYTQVIWKNSQYVGCGTATSARNVSYYVCDYYPPGNYYQRPY